ncbi:MAG: EamA family transporter [Oscillospiraceae bacterium]|nr:EamA family transporter [Oscillospiraceae bacterium]
MFIYTKIDYRFGVVINSLSSVFVMILSRILLREVITKRRIYGNIIVVIGILVFTLF